MAATVQAQRMVSPNGKLTARTDGKGMVVCYDQQPVLEMESMTIGNVTKVLKLRKKAVIEDDYQMLSGKRKHCHNRANEYVARLDKGKILVVRLYDDGVAFRYELSGLKGDTLPTEHTTYRIHEGTKRWMMQWSDAYEGFYPLSTTAKVPPVRSFYAPKTEGYARRWGFPALMQPAADVFVLLSEADIQRQQSAACLFNDGELFRVTPDDNNSVITGDWKSPWRVAIIGHLDEVVASTLITDVSQPCRLEDVSWIHPGVVSWVYWAYNHGSNDFNIIKKYVDMAATLRLPYVLIDAEWDEMKDGKNIEDAVGYAKSRGVKPMIWYNSCVGWIDGAPGPKFRLNNPEDRERELAWCERLGVAGVKIDFFSGDNLKNMDYCLDLLEATAKHHLLVNFHGATIPRGWQRTYPHLLTTEAVYGAEWYNNVPTFTDKAACHNATLPFTRNVIGPMDYTPCAFSDSQHPHITTKAHELALTVLYESGLQHLADRPESFLAQPQAVRDFLGELPSTWDDTRLISGYPGDNAVIARRSGNRWYVAGINGTDSEKTLNIDVSSIWNDGQRATLLADDGTGNWDITTSSRPPREVTCKPRGGFVWVIQTQP